MGTGKAGEKKPEAGGDGGGRGNVESGKMKAEAEKADTFRQERMDGGRVRENNREEHNEEVL